MIVYGASLSPFVRKVLAYGAEKGLELEHKPLGLGSDDPDFLKASPFRKIPGFSDGDFAISDSSAIIHYLEAKYPDPPLIPAEPEARARVIWFDEFADTILCACGAKMFFNRIVAPRFLGREGDLETADKAEREELPPILDYLERTIPENGWLVGDGITLADIAVATAFANLRHLGIEIDPGRHPKVAEFSGRMLARPSFAGWVEREAAFLEKTAA
ncbi:MAG TPA: glutathione S-transferase family protein [Allosphingosinicella sp.]|nr:glutathione S-transferase family protein [Allosphingosinicella sp.]